MDWAEDDWGPIQAKDHKPRRTVQHWRIANWQVTMYAKSSVREGRYFVPVRRRIGWNT